MSSMNRWNAEDSHVCTKHENENENENGNEIKDQIQNKNQNEKHTSVAGMPMPCSFFL